MKRHVSSNNCPFPIQKLAFQAKAQIFASGGCSKSAPRNWEAVKSKLDAKILKGVDWLGVGSWGDVLTMSEKMCLSFLFWTKLWSLPGGTLGHQGFDRSRKDDLSNDTFDMYVKPCSPAILLAAPSPPVMWTAHLFVKYPDTTFRWRQSTRSVTVGTAAVLFILVRVWNFMLNEGLEMLQVIQECFQVLQPELLDNETNCWQGSSQVYFQEVVTKSGKRTLLFLRTLRPSLPSSIFDHSEPGSLPAQHTPSHSCYPLRLHVSWHMGALLDRVREKNTRRVFFTVQINRKSCWVKFSSFMESSKFDHQKLWANFSGQFAIL